jgi:hypothetical protein
MHTIKQTIGIPWRVSTPWEDNMLGLVGLQPLDIGLHRWSTEMPMVGASFFGMPGACNYNINISKERRQLILQNICTTRTKNINLAPNICRKESGIYYTRRVKKSKANSTIEGFVNVIFKHNFTTRNHNQVRQKWTTRWILCKFFFSLSTIIAFSIC